MGTNTFQKGSGRGEVTESQTFLFFLKVLALGGQRDLGRWDVEEKTNHYPDYNR